MQSHNAITLESFTRNRFALLANTSELEGSQVKHTQGKHIPMVLTSANPELYLYL
jgi:hypothetical protein